MHSKHHPTKDSRLNRLAQEALQKGAFTEELNRARTQNIPTFTPFLDLPILFLIVTLGALKPDSWLPLMYGSILAVVIAAIAMLLITRSYGQSTWGYRHALCE